MRLQRKNHPNDKSNDLHLTDFLCLVFTFPKAEPINESKQTAVLFPFASETPVLSGHRRVSVIFIDSLLPSCCTLTIEPSGQGEGLVQTHKRLMVLPEVTEQRTAGTLRGAALQT